MGDRYPFSGDRPLVPSITTIEQEEHVVWSPETAESHISMYQDVSSPALSDTVNEGYVTAEDDNATQYLSVLDATSEISLENLNITLDNSKMTPDDSAEELFVEGAEGENVAESNSEDLNDQQVVVYSMEGSDELFGIQVSQDEDGNMIKYQFQFRKNDDGQLEAIPESIQLLPMDENDVVQEEGVVSEEMVEDGADMKEAALQHMFEHDASEEAHEEYEEEDTIVHYDDEDSQSSQANIDIKPTILEHIPPPTTMAGITTTTTIVKQEREEQRTEAEETAEEATFQHLEVERQFAAADPLDQTDHATLEYQTYEEEGDDGMLESAVTQHQQLPDEDEEGEEQQQQQQEAAAEDEEEQEDEAASSHSPEVDVEYMNEDSQTSTQYFEVHQEYDEDSQQFEERVQQVAAQNRQLARHTHFSGDSIEVHSEDDTYEHVEVNPDLNLSQDEYDEEYEDQPEPEPEPEEPDDEPGGHFLNGNESDNEVYQIVDGMHITGDLDLLDKSNNVNILKQALRASSSNRNNTAARHMQEKLLLYVVQQTEKENVDTGSLINAAGSLKALRTNPRSILKSSFGAAATAQQHVGKTAKDDGVGVDDHRFDERMNKRFARGKEAIQARIFHNFINKTTIPQEPVRKKRLPRKQQIKPVDRVDEEIIVQEMMVSSNGFVEADARFKKGKIKVTEYVDLADSDDEYDLKKAMKKKKKNKKTKAKATVDSDDSIIEVNTSEDEDSQDKDNNVKDVAPPSAAEETNEPAQEDVEMQDAESESAQTHPSPSKRRRGRPSKKSSSDHADDDSLELNESPLKKPRVDEVLDEATVAPTEKTEIQCPKCTKTFPSQNSLKTHLQHHSLQNTLKQQQQQQKQQQQQAESKQQQQKTEHKYRCEKCNNNFKNNALLIRHLCAKSLICAVCKRKFSDVTLLNAHKRTHAKEALVKSTTVAQISPMKMKVAPSSQVFKPPKKTNALKCKHCGKLCSSLQNLSVHLKSHKEYTCGTCATAFVSRMMLDSHVMGNCVKVPQKSTRRSTRLLKPVSSPSKKEGGGGGSSNSRPPATTGTTLKVACSDCPMQFFTHRAMFQHKVAEHGLQTPDKNVLNKGKKPLHQAKPMHGGVRANERLRDAYAKLRSRLVNKDDQQQH